MGTRRPQASTRTLSSLLTLLICLTANGVQAASADSVQATTADTLWKKIQEAAEKCFTGIDVTLEVGGGIERQAIPFMDGSGRRSSTTTATPFGEAKITVPLYSREAKRKILQEKGVFLEHGAAMLGEIIELQARLKVKREEAETLRQALGESGMDGIREYYKILEETEALKAKIRTSTMKIQGWLTLCGVR